MANIFNQQKYIDASNKALDFIKDQMNLVQPLGHVPVSYWIPQNNPWRQYLFERSYIYDLGLALLVFTTSGNHNFCQTIMNRMDVLQNKTFGTYDFGSFDYSYNLSSTATVRADRTLRTGAIGWLVWGMCYYLN